MAIVEPKLLISLLPPFCAAACSAGARAGVGTLELCVASVGSRMKCPQASKLADLWNEQSLRQRSLQIQDQG